MFVYPKNYQDSKIQLQEKIKELKTNGFTVFTSKEMVVENLSIDKITIKSKKATKNRIILNAGLHGIEGYVGHSCMITFLDEFLPTLKEDTEVILYHVLNPFGMYHFRRTNENNVDLNRNFSKNNFTSENPGYDKIKDFFIPKKLSNKLTANSKYYAALVNMIRKHGIPALNEGVLLGQRVQDNGLYYSGTEYQRSTNYIFKEAPKNVKDVKTCVWIDLHTGYGPRFQMSIVNSRYEKLSTEDMIDKINYPLILGLNKDDFYEIDGDMIEKIYDIHAGIKSKTDLYATCFEFGTLGDKTKNTIESLKAMVFDNNCFFEEQSDKMKAYSKKLIKEQFLPSAENWRIKAYVDFKQAISGILTYKKLVK